MFARSDRAKDVRGVVQHMNMKIGEEEVRNPIADMRIVSFSHLFSIQPGCEEAG